MDSPNLSIRIRRHESLPCHSTVACGAAQKQAGTSRIRRHRSIQTTRMTNGTTRAAGLSQCSATQATVPSFRIGRRLGATKNNPYVGSFRHSPPTSLRSMEASSLPSFSSRNRGSSSSPVFQTPSLASMVSPCAVPTMKTSPYVGWFRHAPPSFSSYRCVHPTTSHSGGGRNHTGQRRTLARAPPVPSHGGLNPDSLRKLGRWHKQLTSLLMGMEPKTLLSDTNASASANANSNVEPPPFLLENIVNGRLPGGSDEGDRHQKSSTPVRPTTGNHTVGNLRQPHDESRITILPGYNAVLSRLTSWLLFPLLFADGEYDYDDYVLKSGGPVATTGLKFLEDRSVQIDSDDDDESDSGSGSDDENCDETGDDDSSSVDSCDYNPSTGGGSGSTGMDPETEREFFAEANVSLSEIAEAYYAHRLLEKQKKNPHRKGRFRSDSEASAGLCPATSEGDDEGIAQRLDYEITQMDIARMTRNASRHLDVDSILRLPTISYRKKRRPVPPRTPTPLAEGPEQSYHHVCTPIHEETRAARHTSSGTEDGWSFLMVSGVRSAAAEGPGGDLTTIADDDRSLSSSSSSSSGCTSGGSGDDACVICLEAFKEGDRLRVLPCDHSFHVGCIDRWLSGTHSHNECFTAGCPTCKKRPKCTPVLARAGDPKKPNDKGSSNSNSERETSDGETDVSGSLPSWAFANLGSVMAMSSGDVVSGY